MPTNGTYDAIVVGAGHNGLVCATYLAKAGWRTLVLEAAEEVGGAARTAEIAPGFRVSACAHILHLLHPQVAGDLRLADHGLTYSAQDMSTVALGSDSRHLMLESHPGETARSLRAFSEQDARRLPPLIFRMQRFAGALQPFLGEIPPRLANGAASDRLTLLKLGWAIRRLGTDDMREFLRVIGMNVADLLEDEFETDLLRGAIAFDAVLGTHLGPRSPNSVLTLLYRMAGAGQARLPTLAHPAGGMGAVATALATAARAAGSEIRTGTKVARILIDDDRAAGVELDSGENLSAGTVISNADPRRTFLELLGPEFLDTGFVRRVGNIRMRGTAAKLNLALDGLPEFTGLDTEALGGRLVIAPSIPHIERAFDHAKYGDYAPEPAIEITLPSIHDSTLAPAGKHVLSAVVQYTPYNLKAGWDQSRERFADTVIKTIAAYAPDLKDKILAQQVITPLDLERDFLMTGGHWHHGELTFDQMLMLRPVPGAAQYATPMTGLYLCGAGAHPGGGVMGAAGMNAARQVLKRESAL